jgi:hypothetical protein
MTGRRFCTELVKTSAMWLDDGHHAYETNRGSKADNSTTRPNLSASMDFPYLGLRKQTQEKPC